MNYAQMPGDTPQIHTIDVQLHCLVPKAIRVALRFGLRRILATTMLTLEALATGMCQPNFDLAAGLLAVRTGVHPVILG